MFGLRAGKALLLILIVLTTTTCFRCDPEQDWEGLDVRFVLSFSIQPSSETVRVGDTLWLTAQMDDEIPEYTSGRKYKLVDFDFNCNIGFFELTGRELGLSQQPGAAERFTIANKVGSIDNIRDTFADLNLVYQNQQYVCRIGIVPTNAGVYSINFLFPRGLDFSGIDFGYSENGKRFRPYYALMYYVINNGTANNVDLMRAHCKLGSDLDPETGIVFYEQKGTFTFRVVAK
jgi:hypothetical protein